MYHKLFCAANKMKRFYMFEFLSISSRNGSTKSTRVPFETSDNLPAKENLIKGAVSSFSTKTSEIPNIAERFFAQNW